MRVFLDYLEDIKTECEYLIKRSSEISLEDFIKNSEIQRAFVRALEIIGESSKHIPYEIRKKYPEIKWKNIIAMRNILIHEYFGVDYEVVWKTANESIPELYRLGTKMGQGNYIFEA